LYISQVWERIHDKVNNGVQRDLPDPEFRSSLNFRKLEKSNKVVKEDLRKSSQEFEAAFHFDDDDVFVLENPGPARRIEDAPANPRNALQSATPPSNVPSTTNAFID